MKLRWKCRLKPWEEDEVFIFSQVDRTRVLHANEMRGGVPKTEKNSQEIHYFYSGSTITLV